MARIAFPKGRQSEWVKLILSRKGITVNQVAQVCNVSGRTVRDWRREKNTISKNALLKLCDYFHIRTPSNIQELPDFWYVSKGARKGALRRLELYGPPGTPEGRRKGGINSQIRRRQDPEKYRLLGCNIPKEFRLFGKYSIDLAEAIGIILGDGGLTKYQLRVSVSSIVDRPYAEFICFFFQKVFNDKPTWHERTECNTIDLTISGIELGDELEKCGLLRGDKIKNQVDFPQWIWQNREYQIACVRGLMDTDGGCYFHTHTTKGITYKNFGMCFTSWSIPILQSVAKVLKSLNLKFSIVNSRIYIYNFEEIKKYFVIVGSHNPKNIEKFQYYLNQKSHRIL